MSDPNSNSTASSAEGEKDTSGGFKLGSVQGIEAAFSRAGATNNHTPGYASKLGSQDQPTGDEHQGVGSSKFANGISDQRAEVTSPNHIFRILTDSSYGT